MKIQAHNTNQYLNHMKTLAYLGDVEEWEAHKLYEKLCKIESKMHRLAEMECNGEIEQDPARDEKALKKIEELLPVATGVFINGDPRGYTLKIKPENVKILNENGKINIYQDFGGYGILAPEF